MRPDAAEILDAWLGGRLGELVERVLEPLVGEPFMSLGRAADMVWLGFGDVVSAPTPRNPERRASRHCLHVQCPLRLDSASAMVIASFDIYRPGEDLDSIEVFAWDEPGANLFDRSVEAMWSEHGPGFAVVDAVHADPFGGLHLELSSGHVIKVFPSTSGPGEQWRYFEIGSDYHFVVLPDTR